MTSNARIDSLQLMLTDLRMRNEPIRHKAAFRGCQPEFQALVSRLIEQLEGELLDEKQRSREASRLTQSCLARYRLFDVSIFSRNRVSPSGSGSGVAAAD